MHTTPALRSTGGSALRAMRGAGAFLIAVAAACAGCEQVSDRLPAAACSAATTSVVRFNTAEAGIAGMKASMETLAGSLAKSKMPQVVQASGLLQLQAIGLDGRPELVRYNLLLEALKTVDCTAMYILLDDAPSVGIATGGDVLGDPDAAIMLAQTTRLGAGAEIASKLRIVGEESGVDSLGGGWYHIKPKGTTRALSGGDAAAAAELEAALATVSGASIAVGFRVTQSMRDGFAQVTEDGDDMGMLGAMFSGFEKPLKSLRTGALGIRLGSAPEIQGVADFGDPTAAADFAKAWNGAVRSITSMVGMMLMSEAAEEDGDAEPPVSQKALTNMAEALSMTASQTTVRMLIDDAGWKKLIP